MHSHKKELHIDITCVITKEKKYGMDSDELVGDGQHPREGCIGIKI
jgi:hypothetical protein